MKTMMSLVGRFLFWANGWRFEPLPPYFSSKHVIIGFPHTGNMDTVRAFTGFRIARLTGHVMIKKQWFFWPMGWFLRLIGGIPVDRKASTGMVGQMADHFARSNEFYLAIVPEGTPLEGQNHPYRVLAHRQGGRRLHHLLVPGQCQQNHPMAGRNQTRHGSQSGSARHPRPLRRGRLPVSSRYGGP